MSKRIIQTLYYKGVEARLPFTFCQAITSHKFIRLAMIPGGTYWSSRPTSSALFVPKVKSSHPSSFEHDIISLSVIVFCSRSNCITFNIQVSLGYAQATHLMDMYVLLKEKS